MKAQQASNARGHNAFILDLIRAGCFYDELTDEEKDLYAEYWGTDREALETVNRALFNNSLHFRLKRRLPPPRNREEVNKRTEEVQEAFEKAAAEYNTPEAIAQREAEYKELQRLGELRRMDFLAGRDMDKEHPLPWAKGANT